MANNYLTGDSIISPFSNTVPSDASPLSENYSANSMYEEQNYIWWLHHKKPHPNPNPLSIGDGAIFLTICAVIYVIIKIKHKKSPK